MTYLEVECSYRRAEAAEDFKSFNVGGLLVLNAHPTRMTWYRSCQFGTCSLISISSTTRAAARSTAP
jgi:hypothetical protein